MKEKYKLLYIEWADTTSPFSDNSWWSEEGAIDWAENDDYWVRQTGWLIKETKKFILLADHYNTTFSAGQHSYSLGRLIKIPKTWIRNRKVLKP